MSDDGYSAAKPAARQLPKRFYKTAQAVESESGFAVHLDGRPVRTPTRNMLAVKSAGLAAALAQEWQAQGEYVDPQTMPLNRLVNSALDGVASQMEPVREEIVKYSGTDLVCYRADGPDRLVARQTELWDPVLAWARRDLGSRFVLAEGVMFVRQEDAALDGVRQAVMPLDAVSLAAVNVMTALTGSALIAVAVLRGELDAERAWMLAHLDEDWNVAGPPMLAHVDEDWNIELWGEDEEAAIRRANRWTEMRAAATALALNEGVSDA